MGNKITLPQGYEPSADEPYMNLNQLEYFKQKLIDWKTELLSESQDTIKHLQEEKWHTEHDPTDQAVTETDTGLKLRTGGRYRKLLDKIDQALERIDVGEYGYCEETGEEIGIKRLQARPIATLSIEAQERHENYERTHIDSDDIGLDKRSDD